MSIDVEYAPIIAYFHTPSMAGTFRKKFRKNWKDPGNALRGFPGTPLQKSPKPYNSKRLRLPEHFLNCLPSVRLGTSLFFQKWFWREGFSELVMEFPAVLRAFLTASVHQRARWGAGGGVGGLASILLRGKGLGCPT